MTNKSGLWGISFVLAFASTHCGGKAESNVTGGAEVAASGAGTAEAAGGTAGLADCADAGEPEAGCGGEGGAACAAWPVVNRRGNPVPVCFQIH